MCQSKSSNEQTTTAESAAWPLEDISNSLKNQKKNEKRNHKDKHPLSISPVKSYQQRDKKKASQPQIILSFLCVFIHKCDSVLPFLVFVLISFHFLFICHISESCQSCLVFFLFIYFMRFN